MSSAEWKQKIEEIEKEINSKRMRLQTVSVVKMNLQLNYDYDVEYISMNLTQDAYDLGCVVLQHNQTVQGNMKGIEDLRPQYPDTDAKLSEAISELASEESSLYTSIEMLENNRLSAISSYEQALAEEAEAARRAAEEAARQAAEEAARQAASQSARA